MLGKAVALAVIFKRVDKQQVACLRSVLLRAPQAALLEPFHAAEAAGKVRYNALGNARIARAPAYEHRAPRLAGQAVPRAVLCAVLEFFAVAELRLGNAHEAFALAASGVGKRRRGKSEQHHRYKDKAYHSLSHIFSPCFFKKTADRHRRFSFLLLQIICAVKEGHDLRAGSRCAGRKGGGRSAGGDAVFICPEYRRGKDAA